MGPESLEPHAESWTAETAAALDSWRQGCIIANPPIVWASLAGTVDAYLGELVSADEGLWDYPYVSGADSPAYGVITSQTCDVVTTGPGRRHPFVQVSPVVDVRDLPPDKLQQIRAGDIGYLVWLTGPPETGSWAVDLRVSVPVSKTSLIRQTAVSAFATEGDELLFARRVADKAGRAALHDELQGTADALRGYLRTASKATPTWWEHVDEVRLLVTAGTRLHPASARLLVIEESPLSAAERNVWREFHKAQKKRLRKLGIALEPSLFMNGKKLDVDLYRRSVPLWLPELGRYGTAP